jgi:deoxynucleoside kinase
VEGNIGCGKSTFLRKMGEDVGCTVRLEPVDDWSSLLAKFDEDKARWGFSVQCRILASYLANRMESTVHEVILTERSVASSRHVFGNYLHCSGFFQEDDWIAYTTLYDTTKAVCTVPKVYIYVDTPPEICFERATSRGRTEEAGLSLGYLEGLERNYRRFIGLGEDRLEHFDKVFFIDGTQAVSDIVDAGKKIVASIIRQKI